MTNDTHSLFPTPEDRQVPDRSLTGTPSFQGHLLLAEDEPINQMYLSQLFHVLGVRCQVVADGQQAVEAAATRTFDLIILDIHMPVMDGLEAARRIRELEQTYHKPRTTIIALSAASTVEELEQCRAVGIDECLTKPLDSSQVIALLRRWLVKEPPQEGRQR